MTSRLVPARVAAKTERATEGCKVGRGRRGRRTGILEGTEGDAARRIGEREKDARTRAVPRR